MLKYAQDNHFPNPTFFIDDGVSGVTFDREGFNQMIAAIEAGKVKTVIVKDMSRLGRDITRKSFLPRKMCATLPSMTAWTAQWVTMTLPLSEIFLMIFMRAIQARKSVRLRKQKDKQESIWVNRPMATSKIQTTIKEWIVDEEAAEVVKRIFALCVAGKGPMQIAKVLTTSNIPTVKAYYAKLKNKELPKNFYQWNESSIVGILERMGFVYFPTTPFHICTCFST